MPGVPIFQVDAFTAEPFRGNPAAVCVLDQDRGDAWMQDLAREMNLSETACLRRTGDDWSLRWFTPGTEVDLCGHATLAAAHALWEAGLAPSGPLRFRTRSGVLTARRASDGTILLDFPAEPARPEPHDAALLSALGIAAAEASGRNRADRLVEVRDAAIVRQLKPDMAALARIDMRGVIVTAPSDIDGHDFVSRWFGPGVGVPEDPVTGSAHCCLGPWWAERIGRTTMRGAQLSPRGGSVGVRLVGGRVELSGNAVTVFRGELLI